MLSDSEILEAIKYERIKIEPFDRSKLGPVSYDLTTTWYEPNPNEVMYNCGAEWVFRTDSSLPKLYKLITKEKITLAPTIVGFAACRSKTELRGLIASFSPLVDPGYSGKLIFLTMEVGGREAVVRIDDLYQLMFFRVDGVVNRPYNKLGRTGFDVAS